MKIVTTQYGQSSPSQSLTAGLNILQANPDVTGIIAPDGAAVVGAAAAVEKLGLTGKVFVGGCSDPDSIRQYVKAGIIKRDAALGRGQGRRARHVCGASRREQRDRAEQHVHAGDLGSSPRRTASSCSASR